MVFYLRTVGGRKPRSKDNSGRGLKRTFGRVCGFRLKKQLTGRIEQIKRTCGGEEVRREHRESFNVQQRFHKYSKSIKFLMNIIYC